MKRLLLLASLILVGCIPIKPPIVTPPQLREVAAQVTRCDTKAPIAGARVAFDEHVTTTNVDGHAVLELVLPARYTLTVTHDDFWMYSGSYALVETATLPVCLAPRPPPPPTIPPAPTVLRGQFVIQTRNPFFAQYGGFADRFFMGEIAALWNVNRDEANRIVDEYLALGLNHVPLAPIVARGYAGHYPDSDWRGRGDEYAEFLEWLRRKGIVYQLFVLTDAAPYFLGTGIGWNWDLIERDFTPVLSHPRIDALTLRTATAWEQWASIAEMARAFRYQKRLFPSARDSCWHNGVGHLSPGNSDESEEGAWRSAAANGIDCFSYQATPPLWQADRPTIDQLRYDLWDMGRRFGLTTSRGPANEPSENPWKTPVLARDGQPIRLDWFEGTAYNAYWQGRFEFGAPWRAAALGIHGVRFALDGAPAK